MIPEQGIPRSHTPGKSLGFQDFQIRAKTNSPKSGLVQSSNASVDNTNLTLNKDVAVSAATKIKPSRGAQRTRSAPQSLVQDVVPVVEPLARRSTFDV